MNTGSIIRREELKKGEFVDKITKTTYLTFDDVLIKPGKSLQSRNSADYATYYAGIGDIQHPIIPANMDTVAGVELCEAQLKSGGIAILHRFISIDNRIDVWNNINGVNICPHRAKTLLAKKRFFISVGINEASGIAHLYDAGIKRFCIDIAHAHADSVYDTIKQIKKLGKDTIVIVGNIATIKAFDFLVKAGADIVKVGIGPGSHCTTRIVTGCGVPQLSAILGIAQYRDSISRSGVRYIPIIGDGGLKNSGDITKALSAGANYVMTGSLFAGCDETPGDIVSWKDKTKWKVYRGMASKDAQVGWKSNQDVEKIVAEGESSMVPYRGSFANRLHQLLGGLSSGMSYIGAETIQELHSKAQFVRVTANAVTENSPHGTNS